MPESTPLIVRGTNHNGESVSLPASQLTWRPSGYAIIHDQQKSFQLGQKALAMAKNLLAG
jgi:hypothetical protein